MNINFLNKKFSDFFKVLFSLGIFVILSHIVFQIFSFYFPVLKEKYIFKFFDLGAEANLPTYFSVLLFFFLAIFSYFLFFLEKEKKNINKNWIFLTFLFFFLGLDELAQLHEQLTSVFQEIMKVGGFLFFAWVIPYGILFILFSFYFLPFIYKLENKKFILLGAFIFIFGAIFLEMIGSNYYALGQMKSGQYIFFSSLEESFEIIGLLFALWGLKKEILFKISFLCLNEPK